MFANLKKAVKEHKANPTLVVSRKRSARKQKVVEEKYDPTPNNYRPEPARISLIRAELQKDAVEDSIRSTRALSKLMEYQKWLVAMLSYIQREKGNAVTVQKRDELIGAEKFVEAALFKFGQETTRAMDTIYNPRKQNDPGPIVNSSELLKDI